MVGIGRDVIDSDLENLYTLVQNLSLQLAANQGTINSLRQLVG